MTSSSKTVTIALNEFGRKSYKFEGFSPEEIESFLFDIDKAVVKRTVESFQNSHDRIQKVLWGVDLNEYDDDPSYDDVLAQEERLHDEF